MISPPFFANLVRFRFALGALLVCGLAAPSTHAQAAATGERKFGMSVFAGGSFIDTDYVGHDKGFVVGGDVSDHLRLFDPSLEIRYTKGNGDTVNENTFAGGLKAQRRIGPVRPYIDLEFGSATITFKHPLVNPDGSLYAHDDSLIYVGGGRLDYPASPAFSLKFDAQYQVWKLGTVAGYMTPFAASVGIVYRLPFK